MEINRQIQLFEKQAEKYAKRKRKKSDLAWRRKLLKSAEGKILELSVGAGVNFQFYPKDAIVTAVDFSPSMIEKARETAREEKLDASFIVGNVEEISLPLKSYDTVVSTLSLCSYPNPEKVLKLFAEWCKEHSC